MIKVVINEKNRSDGRIAPLKKIPFKLNVLFKIKNAYKREVAPILGITDLDELPLISRPLHVIHKTKHVFRTKRGFLPVNTIPSFA